MTPGGITAFSRDFASALRGVMAQHSVRQNALAAHLDRSPGFVSEHLSGTRPVDTDMLDAIAELAGMDSRVLVVEVTRRMALAGDPAARRYLTEAEREQLEVDEAAADYARGFAEGLGPDAPPTAAAKGGKPRNST